jgi:hypothetical protein
VLPSYCIATCPQVELLGGVLLADPPFLLAGKYDQARSVLHVSAVPDELPCREDEVCQRAFG